jgi:o-succinylbenzoate synthase
MKIKVKYHKLQFKNPAGTSRGILLSKESWFIMIESDGLRGIGECSLIPGLSPDKRDSYEQQLDWLAKNPDSYHEWISSNGDHYPSISFGLETALADLNYGGKQVFGETKFTNGKDSISINGLIWMGDPDLMRQQIREKIEAGFHCIKLKIGAIDFDDEMKLLGMIRQHFDASAVEIRVDANGAFAPGEALERLKQLSSFQIHSIEQPIGAGQTDEMARLCALSPVPIALDEELIQISDSFDRLKLLKQIKPAYIILKPSLVGGLKSSEQWIQMAENLNIGWWATSALESNIGLNAIAQWVYKKQSELPQGLGTGQLYINNIDSPLEIYNGKLFHNPAKPWVLKTLEA